LILLLLVAAIAPTSAIAAEWYRCRTSGETMSSCCCSAKDRVEAVVPDASEARPACCCDVERTEALSSGPRLRVGEGVVAPLISPAPTEAPRLLVAPSIVAVDVTSTPALPRGPPVFLRNLTLLI